MGLSALLLTKGRELAYRQGRPFILKLVRSFAGQASLVQGRRGKRR